MSSSSSPAPASTLSAGYDGRVLFAQPVPRLGNQFEEDSALRAFLERVLPPSVRLATEADLTRFGERVLRDVATLGNECERVTPQLQQVNGWGARADHIVLSAAWKQLQDISAQEGLIAIGYERAHGVYSRLIQFVKLYLFHPSSATFTCPLAMV